VADRLFGTNTLELSVGVVTLEWTFHRSIGAIEMPDEQRPKEKLVRFDFPPGESAEVIAKAINEMRERIRAERMAKQSIQPPNEGLREEQK
jgi:hypothetical protein